MNATRTPRIALAAALIAASTGLGLTACAGVDTAAGNQKAAADIRTEIKSQGLAYVDGLERRAKAIDVAADARRSAQAYVDMLGQRSGDRFDDLSPAAPRPAD
ncbi:MAG: hypothetical protein ABWY36_00565 [Leifsonia sp.]